MKTITIAVFVTAIIFLSSCNSLMNNGNSNDTIRLVSDDQSKIKMDSAAATKAWTDFRTPGKMQQLLTKINGQWKGNITTWDAPGAAPQKATGTCVNAMIMGGRYQQSINKGTMMGMPFEGMGLVGYDNGLKIFVSNWIDNMGTGFMQMSGPYDSATQTIHFKGTTTEPVTGKTVDVREDFKFLPDGGQLMELYYAPAPGQPEFKTMEIKFTKK